MKIKLISDLHQEFYHDEELYKNDSNVDVLVVAGDLAVGYAKVYRALERFADNYKDVIYVPGNHEYYGNTIEAFDSKLKAAIVEPNIHFLNPGSVKIGEVTFIGATLWTNFGGDLFAQQVSARSINDFISIKEFSTSKACNLYYKHCKFIEEGLQKLEGKKIVVTHFLPTKECIAPRFKGPDLINKYFANSLENLIEEYQPEAWFFGHTHDQINYDHIKTKVVANPYGYYKNANYPEFIYEIL